LPSRSPAPPPGTKSVVDDDNDFAVLLYGLLRAQSSNLCFSPFSIRTALMMALAGARGETAAQMRDALHVSSSDDSVHATLAGIIAHLHAPTGGAYEMAVANSLWGQDVAPLRAEFLDHVGRYYGGGLNRVDFRRHAARARSEINQWVEERTRRRIRELIPAGALNAETRLVLVNAVYFNGTWLCQFPRRDTRKETFHLDGGRTMAVPLMYQQAHVRYMDADGFQAVDLLYQGGTLSMLVLLPARDEGLPGLESRLSARLLHDCVTRMQLREVRLSLPRFRVTWGTVDLRDPLTTLGMSLPFDRVRADFSGINGHRPPDVEALFISGVYHKAFVDVNEEGTEAAAATAGMMVLGRALHEPPAFRADHPFLYAIRDVKSGAILFLGRVADPTRDS